MPSAIEFRVEGLEEITERMNQGPTMMKVSLNEGLRKIGRLIVPAMGTGPLANETPVRTGKLKRSTMFQIMGPTNNQYLEVRQGARSPAGVIYGFIVREGRGPIEAKNAKALRFEPGPPGSGFIFRKRVGPAAPNPYHKRTLSLLMGDIQNIVNQMGERVTAFLSGR